MFLITCDDGSKIVEKLTPIEDISPDEPNRELRLGTVLAHPNLYKVIDESSYCSGQYWSTRSHYVEGETLQERVARDGPLHYNQVIAYMEKILSLLDYLHDKRQHPQVGQVIHKDLKPSNIILSSDNHITVIDLGIARSVGHTKTIALQGSQYFAALEQFRSGKVTPATDIYSLGQTLAFALLGDNYQKTWQQSHSEQFKIPKDSHIPGPLREMLQKMISNEPSDRYSSAKETLNTLVGVKLAIKQAGSAAAHSTPAPALSELTTQKGSTRSSKSAAALLGGKLRGLVSSHHNEKRRKYYESLPSESEINQRAEAIASKTIENIPRMLEENAQKHGWDFAIVELLSWRYVAPGEHQANLRAARLILAWCRKNGFGASTRWHPFNASGDHEVEGLKVHVRLSELGNLSRLLAGIFEPFLTWFRRLFAKEP